MLDSYLIAIIDLFILIKHAVLMASVLDRSHANKHCLGAGFSHRPTGNFESLGLLLLSILATLRTLPLALGWFSTA